MERSSPNLRLDVLDKALACPACGRRPCLAIRATL